MTAPAHDDTAPAAPGQEPALLEAVRAVLEPLARLAVARGLPYATVDEMLRAAFVDAAHAAHAELPEHRRVSRIAAATGLNRREVTRLAQRTSRAVAPQRSLPSELYARWTTSPEYLDGDGRPRRLPRLGPAPSFEALAQGLTRDVHPRALLEAMLKLALVLHDEADDHVALTAATFVPDHDRARMDELLGANVGDHLGAAVANVLGDGRRHLEQALWAGGLSEASLAELRPAIAAHWRALAGELVPTLRRLVERDGQGTTDDAPRHRLRIGLYEFHIETGSARGEAPAAAAPAASGKAARPRRQGGSPR